MSAGPSVTVLGAVTATVAAAPADLRGRRGRELLARLVVAGGQVVSADRLVDDLWAGEPSPNALGALQAHVSYLRRALEPERVARMPATVLVSAAPGYALRLPAEAVDAWHFELLLGRAGDPSREAVARRDLLVQALSYWNGVAYAEFSDSAWAAPEQARLEELRRAAVESLASVDLGLGRVAESIAALEAVLALGPAREETARLLALGLYRAGRQADALAVLRGLRTRLADDLGVDPSPAVRALESDILNHTVGVSGPAQPSAARTPMFGRAGELATIRAGAATATAASAARLVWLAGEAGDGKSTLAQAIALDLGEQGWTVARGRCPEVDGAPPGWAWREVAGSAGLDVDAGLDPFALAQQLGTGLAGRARLAPVLVVLEDLHRADGLTVQLLRQVLDALASVPVLVLATYRPSEEQAALTATRGAVAAATLAHVRLTGLDRNASADVARAAGLTPDDATLDLLVERTGGNPLFVRELARLLAARGRREASHAVPAGVADVLRARAARLPAASLTVLRQAAVLGREVDVDLLADVGEHDVEDVLDALEAPTLAGLIDESAAGRIRFDHALVRDTFYADTPRLRRTRLHARALEVLAERHPGDVDALAYHAYASLRPDTAGAALVHLRRAADEALRAGAAGAAVELYRQALEAAALAGVGDAATVMLLSSAVCAAARAGDVVSGRAFQRAAVTRAGADDLLLRQAVTAWDAPLIWSVRERDELDGVLLGAVRRLVASEPRGADRVLLLRALFLEIENAEDDTMLDASAEALSLAREIGDPRLLCAALNIRAYAALGPDLVDSRDALAAELMHVAAASGQTDYEAAAHWLCFLAAAARGDLLAAQPEVDAAIELAATGQLGGLLGVLAVWRSVLDVLGGDVASGLAGSTAIMERLAEVGSPNIEIMALVGQIVAGFAAGDLAALADPLSLLDEATIGGLTALALLDAGRAADARAAYARTAPARRGYYWLAMTTARAHAAARLGDRSGAAVLLAELAPWTGRVAGLDSGTMPLGPVDDALAACAELLGDTTAARRYRKAADAVRADLARQLEELGRR